MLYCCRFSSRPDLAFSISLSAISIFLSASVISAPVLSYSIRNMFTSRFLSSSLYFKYFFAFSACFSRGPVCLPSSESTSSMRKRFCFSSSRFFSARVLRFLYFTIPAASSKSSLRSSGLPLNILSICPCPIIE